MQVVRELHIWRLQAFQLRQYAGQRIAENMAQRPPDDGIEGLMNLYKFVQDGGTLITEGATSTIFPEYNLTSGITVETPDEVQLNALLARAVEIAR